MMIKRLKHILYERLYDIWLILGVKLYFTDILLDTQDYVRYEMMLNNRKVRTRKDFRKMNETYE